MIVSYSGKGKVIDLPFIWNERPPHAAPANTWAPRSSKMEILNPPCFVTKNKLVCMGCTSRVIKKQDIQALATGNFVLLAAFKRKTILPVLSFTILNNNIMKGFRWLWYVLGWFCCHPIKIKPSTSHISKRGCTKTETDTDGAEMMVVGETRFTSLQAFSHASGVVVGAKI